MPCTYCSLHKMTDSSSTTQLTLSGLTSSRLSGGEMRPTLTFLNPKAAGLKQQGRQSQTWECASTAHSGRSSLFFLPASSAKMSKRGRYWERWWRVRLQLPSANVHISAGVRVCEFKISITNQPNKRRTFSHITCENYITLPFLSLSG